MRRVAESAKAKTSTSPCIRSDAYSRGKRNFFSGSQFPVCRLPEIRLVWVIEIGLEVAEHRGIGLSRRRHRHGLRVAQLRNVFISNR